MGKRRKRKRKRKKDGVTWHNLPQAPDPVLITPEQAAALLHGACPCPACRRGDSLAERVLDHAEKLHPRQGVIVAIAEPPEDIGYSRITLALRFARLPKIVHLRAMVEGWDLPRIVEECY